MTTHVHTYVHTYTHIHTIAYIHTYIHTYIYTYIHTYIRTYIHTYVHTYIHTYVHTYIRTYIHTYVHTYLRTYIYLPTYVPTYVRTYTYVHTHMYIHIHTYTYVHTYVCTYLTSLPYLQWAQYIGRGKNSTQQYRNDLKEIQSVNVGVSMWAWQCRCIDMAVKCKRGSVMYIHTYIPFSLFGRIENFLPSIIQHLMVSSCVFHFIVSSLYTCMYVHTYVCTCSM